MLFSDLNMPLVIAGAAFMVICLLCTGILIHIGSMRAKKKRIEKIRAEEADWSFESVPSHLEEQKSGAVVRLLSAIGLKTKYGKSAGDADTKLKFLRAGFRGERIVPVFWGAKILLCLGFAVGFMFFATVSLTSLNSTRLLYLTAFLGAVGLLLPDFWLILRTRKRQKRIERGFPDALDLLVVCVEAGMGLDAAIHRVGNEIGLTHRELGDELKFLNLELKAGKSRRNALRNLEQRTGIEDVKSLVTLLIQTDRFGTSIAQALRVYSDSFRTARYQRAEEIAAKMGIKLIFPLALCIFPAFFIVGVGPALIGLFTIFGNK